MTGSTKRRIDRNPMSLANITLTADELIRIRTLEQRLCRKLNSSTPQSGESLLSRLHNLNLRVDLVDGVLES
jgi:hypothetical protein